MTALALAATALLLFPSGTARRRIRARRERPSRNRRRVRLPWPIPSEGGRPDPLALAAGWDLFAVCTRAGLPVPVVLRAVAAEHDGNVARILHEVADHLALGSDPLTGWEPALAHPDTAELARAARRTARTGSALAATAADLAERCRGRATDQAEVRAQRAAVWITAPLGLCFLPAFLCLGVVPVVLGMVHELPVP